MKMQMFIGRIEEALKNELSREEVYFWNYDNLVSKESELTLKELQLLIEQHASLQVEVNVLALNPFVEWLKKRWLHIQDTDAIYSHNPKTHANRVCIQIASILAQILHCHPYDLLIPSLKLPVSQFPESLKKVVMSDNNHTFIDVMQCLSGAHQNQNGVLYHTHPVDGGNTKIPLTESEQERVINYSAQSRRYYQEILKKSESGQLKAKNDLGKNIGYCRILASYGPKKNQKLVTITKAKWEGILNKIDDIDMLLHEVSQCETTNWKNFVSQIPLPQLQRLVLGDNTLEYSAKNNLLYNGVEEHDRMVAFLKNILYQIQLRARPHDKNSFWARFDKHEKLKASGVFEEFLLSEAPFKHFNVFLAQPKNAPYKGALNDGLLDAIVHGVIPRESYSISRFLGFK